MASNYFDPNGVAFTDENGDIIFAKGSSVPSDGSSGYAKGCLFLDTDASAGNVLALNEGSSSSSDFNLIDPAGGGGGSTPTWEDLFTADATFTITSDTTWTIAGNRSTATDVVTFTNIAGGSGDVIKISNSGTGKDISGTSDTWSFSKAGALTCVGITNTSDITTTGAAIDWDLVDNNASALSFDAAGKAGILAIVTTNSSEGVTMSGILTVSGKITGGVGSNTVNSLIVQDDTVTTFGTGTTEDAGVVVFSSDTLTTGNLLRLQLDESALNGGHFLKCVETDAGTAVFSIGENGAVTISGSGGNNVLTLTAGDAVLSDGSLTITDADDADTLSVTNNSAVSNGMVVFTGSGAYTGSTTSSFFVATPTGLTTGTGGYIATDAITTGKTLHLVADSAAITTGEILTVSHASGDITGTLNKTGNLASVASTRTVTTGTVSDNFDMLSLVRTSIINGAGAFTAAGSVLYIENAVTNTSGTVSDTVKGIEIVMDSLGTGDGVKITHAATGGKALNIVSAATTVSDVLITGSGAKADNKASLEITNSGATAAGGSIFRVTNTGTPADATSYLVDFDYSGATMTNNPVGVYIHGGSSTAQAVEIVSTGAGADDKGVLSVTTSGATAAGGSVLRVTGTGTPAAATSYLVDFDYSGATFTNNPDTVFIGTDGTGRALHISDAGLKSSSAPNVDIESTNAGAVGAVLRLSHQGGSQAASDVLGQIVFLGEDDAAADNIYGQIQSVVVAATAGSERGRLDFLAGDASGGVSQVLRVDHDGTNGIVSIGDGAATAIIQSLGNYDLKLQTGNATTGNITITDGADGAITLTPNGNGAIDLAGKIIHSETTTSSGPGAVSVNGAIHEITTTGADALTLADGTEGQVLTIVMVVDGGNGTLTPTNLAGGTTITFDDVGDAVTLTFTNGSWFVTGQNGVTIA